MNVQLSSWKIAPAKFIAHAIEHAGKDSDFDHQMAFLLLDIGIENLLKSYLKHRQEYKKLEKEAAAKGREVSFYSVVQKVNDLLSKPANNFDSEKILSFHEVRNDLYHEKVNLKPLDEDLKSYIDIAKTLLTELLGVDVKDVKTDPVFDKRIFGNWDEWEGERFIEEIDQELKDRIKYFHESCSLLTEILRPKYASRKFALELHTIWVQYGGDHKYDWHIYYDEGSIEYAETIKEISEEKIRSADERVRLFREVTGTSIDDYDFVDFVLENVNHLYVRVALQDCSENINEDWEEYLKKFEEIDRGIIKRANLETIVQEYKDLVSWIKRHQNKIDERLDVLLPNIKRPDFNLSIYVRY